MTKEVNCEIYTTNPATGEGGWDIKFRSVIIETPETYGFTKENKRLTKEQLKLTPDFDCVILFNTITDAPADKKVGDWWDEGILFVSK